MAPKTIIIRHTRENIKKCSLQGLEKEADFQFFTYPDCVQAGEFIPSSERYVLLAIDGPPLSREDIDRGLILVDSTWRLAEKILRCTPQLQTIERRSIPQGIRTAYPRRQDDCPDPEAGLASIEALYVAFFMMGKSTERLLDSYYWKENFLEKNKLFFTSSRE